MRGVVVVGPGGIGEAVSRWFIEQPVDLIVGWHASPGPIERLSEAHRDAKSGATFTALPIDVTDPESCKAFFKSVRRATGSLSAIVNCFGRVEVGPGIRTSPDVVDALIRDNLSGVINVCRSGVFSLMKSGGGALVNVGSISSEHALAGLSVYSAAKAGVVAFTRTLAVEAAPYSITCNVVLPGFIDCGTTAKQPDVWREAVSRDVPLGRLGAAREVADLVGFLASPTARYITGQAIAIDGGWSIGAAHLSLEMRKLAALLEDAAREPS